MRIRFIFAVMFALLLVPAVSLGDKKYDPFKVPREQIKASVKTIALHAIPLPEDLPRRDEIQVALDSLITMELKAGGFAVVPPGEYDLLWKQGADSAGALFDPATGKRDTTKSNAIRMGVLRGLKDRFQADAVLHSSLQSVRAMFSGPMATWDGTRQTVSKGVMGFLNSSRSSGLIPALSLYVVVEDAAGNDLYRNAGGLEVTAKLSGSGTKIEPLPPDSLFTHPQRSANAVHVALAALTETDTKHKK